MLTSDPAFLPKPLCTHRLHKNTPTQDTVSRSGKVNISPNFIETEKIKQNEKTVKSVSKKRPIKKTLKRCVRGGVSTGRAALTASEWFSPAPAHCACLTPAPVGSSAGGPGPVTTKREPGAGRERSGGG